jgi:uncharacterized protein YndB with AHSA1/START domain
MSHTPKRTHHGRTIDTTVRINTTPDQAWTAWADPQAIANWFVDRAEGVAAPGEVMTWFFDTFNYRQPVPVLDAQPGEVFVIGSGDEPGPHGIPYLMEILIERDAGGATVVRLLNSGFSPDAKFDEEFEGVVSGWTMALATLKYWLEQHPGARRTHLLSMAPAQYDWATLTPLFATPQGRQWLEPMLSSHAPTLADTGREVLLACPARAAVIGLKAFRMGRQSMVALDFSSWADDPGVNADIGSELPLALERLKRALS